MLHPSFPKLPALKNIWLRSSNEMISKQSKKSIKEVCQANYEKKRFIQSFKPRE